MLETCFQEGSHLGLASQVSPTALVLLLDTEPQASRPVGSSLAEMVDAPRPSFQESRGSLAQRHEFRPGLLSSRGSTLLLTPLCDRLQPPSRLTVPEFGSHWRCPRSPFGKLFSAPAGPAQLCCLPPRTLPETGGKALSESAPMSDDRGRRGRCPHLGQNGL